MASVGVVVATMITSGGRATATVATPVEATKPAHSVLQARAPIAFIQMPSPASIFVFVIAVAREMRPIKRAARASGLDNLHRHISILDALAPNEDPSPGVDYNFGWLLVFEAHQVN